MKKVYFVLLAFLCFILLSYACKKNKPSVDQTLVEKTDNGTKDKESTKEDTVKNENPPTTPPVTPPTPTPTPTPTTPPVTPPPTPTRADYVKKFNALALTEKINRYNTLVEREGTSMRDFVKDKGIATFYDLIDFNSIDNAYRKNIQEAVKKMNYREQSYIDGNIKEFYKIIMTDGSAGVASASHQLLRVNFTQNINPDERILYCDMYAMSSNMIQDLQLLDVKEVTQVKIIFRADISSENSGIITAMQTLQRLYQFGFNREIVLTNTQYPKFNEIANALLETVK